MDGHHNNSEHSLSARERSLQEKIVRLENQLQGYRSQIDILDDQRQKLEKRALNMESALTKTKKQLLEAKKEVLDKEIAEIQLSEKLKSVTLQAEEYKHLFIAERSKKRCEIERLEKIIAKVETKQTQEATLNQFEGFKEIISVIQEGFQSQIHMMIHKLNEAENKLCGSSHESQQSNTLITSHEQKGAQTENIGPAHLPSVSFKPAAETAKSEDQKETGCKRNEQVSTWSCDVCLVQNKADDSEGIALPGVAKPLSNREECDHDVEESEDSSDESSSYFTTEEDDNEWDIGASLLTAQRPTAQSPQTQPSFSLSQAKALTTPVKPVPDHSTQADPSGPTHPSVNQGGYAPNFNVDFSSSELLRRLAAAKEQQDTMNQVLQTGGYDFTPYVAEDTSEDIALQGVAKPLSSVKEDDNDVEESEGSTDEGSSYSSTEEDDSEWDIEASLLAAQRPTVQSSQTQPSFSPSQAKALTTPVKPVPVHSTQADPSGPTHPSNNSALIRFLVAKSPIKGGKQQEEDCILVYEVRASMADREKASRLFLPPNFFNYTKQEACPGCNGCRGILKEVANFNKKEVKENWAIHVTSCAKENITNSDTNADTFQKLNKGAAPASFSFQSPGAKGQSNSQLFSIGKVDPNEDTADDVTDVSPSKISFSSKHGITPPQKPSTPPSQGAQLTGPLGTGTPSKFTFSLALSPGSPARKPTSPISHASPQSPESPVYGDDDGPHFEPLIPLPEKVECLTGEKDQEVLFCERCKLFRYDSDTSQWKERGVGNIKILRNPSSGRHRVLMRREQIFKLCANHVISVDMELKPFPKSDRAWLWTALADFSEEVAKAETLAARFRTKEIARQFKGAFDKAVHFFASKTNAGCLTKPVGTQPDQPIEGGAASPGPEILFGSRKAGFLFSSLGTTEGGGKSAFSFDRSSSSSFAFSALKVRLEHNKHSKTRAQDEGDKRGEQTPSDVIDDTKGDDPHSNNEGGDGVEDSNKKETPVKAVQDEDEKGLKDGVWKNLLVKWKPKEVSWECDICMVGNNSDTVKCKACESPKPGVEQSRDQRPGGKSLVLFGSGVASSRTGLTFGSSTPSSGTEFASSKTDDGEEDATDGDHHDGPHFEPIIPLPDKIDVKTGEEEEEVMFSHRAKLYRFAEEKQWKERGVGDIRLLRNNQTGKMRVLMRREQVLKLCANHQITTDMKLQPNAGSDRSWVWSTPADFSEQECKAERLAVRFKNEDIAKQFKEKFEECQEILKNQASQMIPNQEGTEQEEEVKDHLTKFKATEGSWQCDICMVRNDSGKAECAACGSLKRGVEPSQDQKTGGKPLFSSGSGATSPETGFTFGTSAPSSSSGFTFGSAAPSSSSVISFGSGGTGFSFSTSGTTEGDAKPVFTFASRTPSSGSGFTIGLATPSSGSEFTFGPSAPSSGSRFTFGPSAPFSGSRFTFGSSAPSSGTGFTFESSAPPSSTFGSAAPSSGTGFTFGSSGPSSGSGFTFGPSVSSSGSKFTFGSSAPSCGTGFTSGSAAPSSGTGFTFGSAAPSSGSGFTFESALPSSGSGFTFASSAPSSGTGSTFGSAAPSSGSGLTFGSAAPSSGSGLTFGSAAPSSGSGLTFGSAAPSSGSGFTFGSAAPSSSSGISFGSGGTGFLFSSSGASQVDVKPVFSFGSLH